MATKKTAEKSAAKTETKTAAKKSAAPAKSAAKKTATKTAAATSPTKSSDKRKATHAEISELAHKYYTERGHAHHGKHVDDWLRAEKELNS